MRTGIGILMGGLLFVLLTDTILYLEIRRHLKRRILAILFWLHSVLFAAGMIAYHFLIPRLESHELYFWIGRGIVLLILFYVPKILFISIDGFSRLLMLLRFKKGGRFVFHLAWVVALAAFIEIGYGITWRRYNYRVIEQEVALSGLPEAFEGYRIVQLTDLHLGSFGKNYPGVARLVERVNGLQPDLLVFTGDMVNNFADELLGWKEVLRGMHAADGCFAVTGNHDYGDYTRWSSPEAKKENLYRFFQYMQESGFTMLNNRSVPLVRQKDTLWLAGVENWGKPPFPVYGSLREALQGTEQPVILLSHDPSHWRGEVLHYPVALTLSGHTHAMQLGITWRGRHRSPAGYVYPEFNGLYRQGEHQLYVSRGLGYVGFAGRIGQRPEITLIRLTRRKAGNLPVSPPGDEEVKK